MKKVLLGIAAAVVMGIGLVAPAVPAITSNLAYADETTNPGSQFLDTTTPSGMPGSGENNGLMDIVKNIINAAIGLVGVAAVIMMIIGGVSFITSQGDANKVTKAHNTILYGVVGLIVALLAFAIVNFVLSNVFNASESVWLSLF